MLLSILVKRYKFNLEISNSCDNYNECLAIHIISSIFNAFVYFIITSIIAVKDREFIYFFTFMVIMNLGYWLIFWNTCQTLLLILNVFIKCIKINSYIWIIDFLNNRLFEQGLPYIHICIIP